jgi:hypothetical protein
MMGSRKTIKRGQYICVKKLYALNAACRKIHKIIEMKGKGEEQKITQAVETTPHIE